MARSRRWIWYFALLALLGTIAVVTPLVYNLSIQLEPDQLQAARERWQTNGPADYVLLYQERVGTGPVERLRAEVRRGRVVKVSQLSPHGKFVPLKDLSSSEAQTYSVPALFGQIERDLEEDLRTGRRRNFATARFDSRTGYPMRYVHRVAGTQERVEWRVELLPTGGERE